MIDKLEFVLNKIKEKCPELMDLSPGCIVEAASCPDGCCGLDTWVIDSSMDIKGKTISHLVFKDTFYITKIIGHEPRLEHLLRAINKYDTRTSTKTIEETIIRFTIEAIIGQDVICVFANYDLTKSVEQNLEQNEELLNFLYSLLNQE
jgi:hypothetical protein